MIQHVVVVKDRALDAFLKPIFTASLGVAERAFRDEVNNKDSDMFKHPSDFDLYNLGVYHDQDASFHLLEVPQLIMRAQDVREGGAS